MAFKERYAKVIFRNCEKKDEIIEYLKNNSDYYSYDELLELLHMHFNFTWSDKSLLLGVFKKYGIPKPNKIPMKTIHIESIFRCLPEVERMLNAKNLKKEKEDKYAKQIQDKLDRLKQMDVKAQEESNDE